MKSFFDLITYRAQRKKVGPVIKSTATKEDDGIGILETVVIASVLDSAFDSSDSRSSSDSSFDSGSDFDSGGGSFDGGGSSGDY